MSYQTRCRLTILLSGIFFGLAGLWLASDKAKGALIGATTGSIGAGGFVFQDKRLRELASQQRQIVLDKPQQDQLRPDELGPPFGLPLEQQNQITTIESELRSSVAQIKLYGNDIQRILARLHSLESRIDQEIQNDNGVDFGIVERLAARLQTLETKSNMALSSLSGSRVDAEAFATRELGLELDDMNEDVEAAIQWLKLRQTEVESSYEPDPKIDSLLDGLSLYLGENYATLSEFHWKLRSNVGRKLYFNLANYGPREKSVHNQYISRLRSSAFLRFGRIIKGEDKPDYIIAISHDRPDIQGFFDGGWFERFIYTKIVELFDAEGIQYESLRNPRITYANGEESELDLFFLVDDKPLLIECKAGQNYDSAIERFVQHQKKLGIDSNAAIFVVLDIGESEAYIRTKRWSIAVTNQTSLIEHIKATLLADELDEDNRQELGDSATADNENQQLGTTTSEPAYGSSGLSGFFKQQNLNLAPGSRTVVLNYVIELIDQESPISFNTITKTIRDRMEKESSSLARHRIREILNCLRYSDIFRDDKNKPVRNVNVPISSMASVEHRILEKKCMEFYAQKVIQMFDPDFFDIDSNVEEFKQLTHGEVPPAEKITQFKAL